MVERDYTSLGPVEYDKTQVPAEIKKYADYTRSKAYGVDVRESIARASEIAGLIAKKADDDATVIATKASSDAGLALEKSTSTQLQLDQVVISGDSSVEAAQARVDANDVAHNTLKTRLDYNDTLSEERFNITTFKVTNNNKYNAWPQGKGFVLNNVIYLFYNTGITHGGSDLRPVFVKSYDGGKSFTEETVISNNPSSATYPRGVSCWASGTDGEYIYAIILYRGNSTAVGSYKHVLFYGLPTQHPREWTQKEITISKDGYVPNQYHGFSKLPDGSIAFGYNFLSGETGIVKTFDKGDTWEKHVMFTDTEMSNDINNCEAEFVSDGTTVFGFLRGEGRDSSIKPKFWTSTDSCQTFNLEDATGVPFATNIPIAILNGNVYAFQSERTGLGRAHLYEANLNDVILNGFRPLLDNKIFLTNLNYSGKVTSGSGTGVGQLIPYGDNLNIFFGSENENGMPDIYEAIVNFERNRSRMTLNASPVGTFPDVKTEVHYTQNTAQTFATNTASPAIFKFSLSDTLKEYNNVTGVFKPQRTGVYAVKMALQVSGVPHSSAFFVDIYENGVFRTRSHFSQATASTADTVNRVLYVNDIFKFTYDTDVQFMVTSVNGSYTTNPTAAYSYLKIYGL